MTTTPSPGAGQGASKEAVDAARPFVQHSDRCRRSGCGSCLCSFDARLLELAGAFQRFAEKCYLDDPPCRYDAAQWNLEAKALDGSPAITPFPFFNDPQPAGRLYQEDASDG